MLTMLIAYDEAGTVIATLDALAAHDQAGTVIGLADFAAIEAAGAPLRLRDDGSEGVWHVDGATGSGSWPEWLSPFGFTVETEGTGRDKRITALVHPSGHRRERAAIEAEIARRFDEAPEDGNGGKVVDLRDLLGGPDRPLRLDAAGATEAPQEPPARPSLPIIARTPGVVPSREL